MKLGLNNGKIFQLFGNFEQLKKLKYATIVKIINFGS